MPVYACVRVHVYLFISHYYIFILLIEESKMRPLVLFVFVQLPRVSVYATWSVWLIVYMCICLLEHLLSLTTGCTWSHGAAANTTSLVLLFNCTRQNP